MEEERKEMSIRERIEWLLDRIGKEKDAEGKFRIVIALLNKVYAGERF